MGKGRWLQRLSATSRGETQVPEIRRLQRFRAAPALDPTLLHLVFVAGETHTDRVREERNAELDLFSAAGGGMRTFIQRLVGKHSQINLQEFPFVLVERTSIASSPFKLIQFILTDHKLFSMVQFACGEYPVSGK